MVYLEHKGVPTRCSHDLGAVTEGSHLLSAFGFWGAGAITIGFVVTGQPLGQIGYVFLLLCAWYCFTLWVVHSERNNPLKSPKDIEQLREFMMACKAQGIPLPSLPPKHVNDITEGELIQWCKQAQQTLRDHKRHRALERLNEATGDTH